MYTLKQKGESIAISRLLSVCRTAVILTSTKHTSEDFKLDVRTIKFTLSGCCITNFTRNSLEATHLVNVKSKIISGHKCLQNNIWVDLPFVNDKGNFRFVSMVWRRGSMAGLDIKLLTGSRWCRHLQIQLISSVEDISIRWTHSKMAGVK